MFRFAAIGQSDVGEQLRAALGGEGYGGGDDGAGKIISTQLLKSLVCYSNLAVRPVPRFHSDTKYLNTE